MKISRGLMSMLLLGMLHWASFGQEMPRIAKKDGRFSLLVDGKPFLILGAQINNSSSWASILPQVWPALEAIHANTVEAPVYWEQIEPEQGRFDFTNVDLLLNEARAHKLHLILLWFGTWKNGQAHYVPEWVKLNPEKYPREISAYGKVLDVMSPNAPANLEADKTAFAALMRHIREIDSADHTVLMIQVENESGSIGSVRDFSPLAQKQFEEDVPSSLHMGTGTWSQVFGADADERFAAYSTARYINEVAAAGKAEYALPMYCNVWLTYPVHASENRNRPSPGQEYPSGGPQQGNIAIWKVAAPEIDALSPDFYSDDMNFYREVIAAYHRPDNTLFIPETGLGNNFGRYLFYALGHGAIGFSPFGVDFTGWSPRDEKILAGIADNFALFQPIEGEIAQLNFDGKVQTVVEDKGEPRKTLRFGDVDAIASFGFPQHDGAMPPGTPGLDGRAMVAQLGPLDFLVTGFDTSVSFRLSPPADGKAQTEQLEILEADEGQYENGVWHTSRIWNGDQTDRGLRFGDRNTSTIRIRLHRLPLHETGWTGPKR